jgi:hypothetical protein
MCWVFPLAFAKVSVRVTRKCLQRVTTLTNIKEEMEFHKMTQPPQQPVATGTTMAPTAAIAEIHAGALSGWIFQTQYQDLL